MVCPVLCSFLRKVQSAKTKFSALAELNEDFGDKFDRLFANQNNENDYNASNNLCNKNEAYEVRE